MNVPIYENERVDRVNEDLTLILKKEGLTLSTDAYLLAAFVRPVPSGRAVELGAGTGILSLLLATRRRFAHVDALEIQPDFVSLAERNVAFNDLCDRVTVHGGDLREARPEDFGGEADAVISNPPYMKVDSGKRNTSEYQYIARHEVCGTVADFCHAAARLVRYGGYFYCVYRPDRLSELMGALRDNRLEPKTMVFVHADGESEPSSVLVAARRGGSPGLRILPPLLLHDGPATGGARRLSPRAEAIYATMRFE